MHTRKIQLIANTTYSVSLPKKWVQMNNLREKSEVQIRETANNNLLLAPQKADSDNRSSDIELNQELYKKNIEGIIMTCYYKGYEKIKIISRTEIENDYRRKIKRLINYMSGTEITFEDNYNIIISNLLDKSKVDVRQTLYRIGLVMESSLEMIAEDRIDGQIENNEVEIDRLSHLITKICSIAMTDMKVLSSSKIKDINSIPSFLIIGKKLENMGDSIAMIAEQYSKSDDGLREILKWVSKEIDRCLKYVISRNKKIFDKISNEKIESITSGINNTKDRFIRKNMFEILDYLEDIEEEIVTISFQEKILAKDME